MDLSALNSSLPPGLADAERDMGDKFRAAALSITTLYKSSLALNKHAYQVGYSAALADVLSKLQSDIAAGEDAASALARLMDWTEARQTAMAAFAADDEEQPGTAQRPATSQAQPLSHIAATRQFAPQRPASAPIPGPARNAGAGFARDSRDHLRDTPGPSSLRTEMMEEESPVAPTPAPRRQASSLASSSTLALDRSPSDGIVAPIPLPSSSPTSSPSLMRGIAPPPLRLQRNLGSRAASSSTTLLPTSTFNFSIPTTLEIPPQSGPAQTGPIGSKRPIIDAEMADGTINVGAAPSTPSRSGGRASKRRSLGLGLGMADQEEKEPRSADRRRQPRRGGHGASGGGVQRASSPL